jgi:hypothetical protein
LPEDRRFNDFSGHYEGSEIDQFLNSEYLATLAPAVQAIIPETFITIAARSAMLSTNEDELDILRKVFLLSYNEVYDIKSHIAKSEGKFLKYFDSMDRRVVNRWGEGRSWWLRSGYSTDDMAAIVMYNGSPGGFQALNRYGVRPAFCLSQAIPVKQVMAGGAQIYLIDFESMEGWEPDYVDPTYEEPQRYMVEVQLDNSHHGAVTGGGLRQAGEAEVMAWETTGTNFIGWFEDGQEICAEPEYRFIVDRDRELEARYNVEEGTRLLQEVKVEGGGYFNARHGYYGVGNSVKVEARPDTGFRFVQWHAPNGGIFREPEEPNTFFVMPDNDAEIYAEFEKIE